MTREMTVLTFQMGDGLSNLLWPTATSPSAAASAACPLSKWWKFFVPLFGILYVTQMLTVVFAQYSGILEEAEHERREKDGGGDEESSPPSAGIFTAIRSCPGRVPDGGQDLRVSGRLGIEYRRGAADTGIVALVRGERPGKTVGIRADMDALPLTEEAAEAMAPKILG